MRNIQELRASVDAYQIRRLSDRWTNEELCDYFSITLEELYLILDLSI